MTQGWAAYARITSGAFVALFPAGVASLGSFSDLGRRAGALMSIMALGTWPLHKIMLYIFYLKKLLSYIGALAGPPISGAIVRAKHSFRPVGAYAGTMIVLSVILMIISRYTALKRVWGGKMWKSMDNHEHFSVLKFIVYKYTTLDPFVTNTVFVDITPLYFVISCIEIYCITLLISNSA